MEDDKIYQCIFFGIFFLVKWIVLSCQEKMGEVCRNYFFIINVYTVLANLLDFVLIFFEKRIPEWILHFFTVFGGGTVNLSLMIFRHRSFEDSYHENLVLCCSIHMIGFIILLCCIHQT